MQKDGSPTEHNPSPPRSPREARLNAGTPPLEPVPYGHRVKGVSTYVNKDGNTRGQWIKTTSPDPTPEEVLEAVLATLPATIPTYAAPTAASAGPFESDLMAVYPMGDPHVGMLAWAPESGADWDLHIAEQSMAAAVSDLVERGPRTKVAMLINLGDYFHADNAQDKTTKGDHTLDVDGRAPKIMEAGMRIFLHAIACLLRHHESVIVDSQRGNHDGHTALMLRVALKHIFRDEPRVTVICDPAVRHYHRFGKVLIGTVHGDTNKLTDLESIMAAERPEDWGETDHRYWYVGHVHHSQIKEFRGCTVETFRTLAAKDSWHAAQGYTSGRDMRRLVLHREWGEVGREVACFASLASAVRGAA